MEEVERKQCSQCDHGAVVSANDAFLCVDCYYKLEVARTLNFRIAAINMNHAIERMDQIAPWGAPSPRVQVPEIPKGPVILNNIQIDNSIVGSINTGIVHSIDVNITRLDNAGSERVSIALKQLSEAIANDNFASARDKNNALDLVAFLSEQAVTASDDRRVGLIRSTLDGIDKAARTIGSVGAIWDTLKPIIDQFFS